MDINDNRNYKFNEKPKYKYRTGNMTGIQPDWTDQFTLPQNGIEGLEETSYFTIVSEIIFFENYLANSSPMYKKNKQYS